VEHLQRQNSALEQIGFIGGQMIKEGARIATFSTSGSVYKIFQHAVAAGKKFTVTGHEARPGNEGYRTLKEAGELGISVTFGVDAILGHLVPGSSFMVIGADAITSTGDVLAKVGSYLGALVCKENNIPFYVAADTSKFDTLTLDGFPIKDRLRPPEEVSEISVPIGSEIVNLSFEIIPARFVSGIITEMGVIPPASVAGFMKPSELSPQLIEKLRGWLKKPTRL
jgi:translation initiation factor 2B subunit (eIF-2B alpha/beta/delta family)